ncbi:homoserine dehydrogenase [Fimbriiglobus ruber]|uniref:Homoserine dehydrogenase n=1 Tax=Fimbriiglobus ruber TaxID=1908690 RepID=A0A225E2R0_9BACT|nr:homoserine dehydrogenase [Fimbriiglobus ruber]OWK44366.1 Homoserine dehydrogenase [Fimbriiglobus ruber]
MSSEPLGVALVGCGTVGTGVAKLLLEKGDRLAQRAGRSLVLRKVVVRDPAKVRGADVPRELVTTDLAAVHDPAVHVVAELIGGTTTARKVVLDALAAGKHVVTANKALLAEHGPELFEAARKVERTICFEAAVAGGVPIIRALAESLAANQVTALQGILNGTSNFILTSMAEQGTSYAAALAEAQRLGYAEADPTLDVDGSDAAHKLAVLAQIAFGVTAKPHEIEKIGIDTIDAMDIRFADELGYTIKLLAEAWADNGRVALHVAPVLLRHTDMLAQVRGAFNAVQVVGDVVGETLYQGPGAGMMPTASSVVADLIDLAVGRAQRTFAAAKLWSGQSRGFVIEPSETVRSRFYLRLLVLDRPGVLADVCRILADHAISISSVIQHEALEGRAEQTVPLVIMTHYSETGKFRAAVGAIGKVANVAAPAVFYSVDD